MLMAHAATLGSFSGAEGLRAAHLLQFVMIWLAYLGMLHMCKTVVCV